MFLKFIQVGLYSGGVYSGGGGGGIFGMLIGLHVWVAYIRVGLIHGGHINGILRYLQKPEKRATSTRYLKI